MATYKGRYRPSNPKKYKGDPTNIIYRSSWELKFMKWCDLNEAVIEWQSEEFCIPYKSPIDGRFHRYFPDFLVKIKNKDSLVETWVVEIKPLSQTKEPRPQKRLTKKYLNEVKTYAINKYKWDYALEWCKDRNYKFVIFTERELNIR
jgi:hypothetical protein